MADYYANHGVYDFIKSGVKVRPRAIERFEAEKEPKRAPVVGPLDAWLI